MAEYGRLERLLHRMALQVGPLAELSFDLDQRWSDLDVEGTRTGHHVFVAGLARAGTTVLLRRIDASGDFRSLTYRDMPFVLAPGLWRSVRSDPLAQAPAERAHGDRILVNVDSPEALEEVFWRVFDRDGYMAGDHLRPHAPGRELMERYVAYVSAILASDPAGRRRYLAKNNNNVLRLESLCATLSESTILIPFRHPVAQASSLLRQHLNFSRQQRIDGFVRTYMTALCHHEFGLDHRPFRFSDQGATQLARRRPESIDYWLELWRQVYSWLARNAPPGALFIAYEDLCSDPDVWKQIAIMCDIEPSTALGGATPFSAGNPGDPQDTEDALLDATSALYSSLVQRSRDSLRGGG